MQITIVSQIGMLLAISIRLQWSNKNDSRRHANTAMRQHYVLSEMCS